MKTSKSHLWQIPGCRMFSGFLILLIHGTFGQETSIEPTMEPPAFAPSTAVGLISDTPSKVTFHPTELPTKKLTKKDADIDISSKAHPASKSLVATSSKKETTSVSTSSLKQLSTPGTITEQKELATLKQTKQVDAATDIHTSTAQESPTTTASAIAPDKTEATKVVGKHQTTVEELTSSSTTAATVRDASPRPRSTKRKKEESTTPGQHVQGDPTTHETSSWGPDIPGTTETSIIKESEGDTGVEDPSKGSGGEGVTPTNKAPHADPKTTASPAKGSRAVTVAIVLSVLLLIILLIAFLACWRRRRHSGSTSFKEVAWAGQAALPDDSGLDKEAEQGTLTAGERETRRATLTTFFGKRQSRVPSVAMEEVVQKEAGGVEEAQHLIDKDVSSVSSLEGSGEANGKLPEHAAPCSQEKEFPPPPANQEETPPTQLE